MFQGNRLTPGLWFSLASGLWMALIFFLSSLEGPEYTGTLIPATGVWTEGWQSYLAHAFLYGVLAILIQKALWGWRPRCQLRWVLVAALCAAGFGITDEYHQSFVSGRTASVADALVDSIAALVAAALLWARYSLTTRSKAPVC